MKKTHIRTVLMVFIATVLFVMSACSPSDLEETTTAAEITAEPDISTAPETTVEVETTTEVETTIETETTKVEETTEAPHTHSFGEWNTVKAESCSEEGMAERSCACGAKETETIAKAPHSTSEWIVDKEATCTESGSKHKSCIKCGETTDAETIPSKGHTEVTDNAKPETCTESGLTEGKHCSVCQTVFKAQETIPSKGHTEVTDSAKSETCTESGLTEGKHCSVCQAVITAQSVIPATGHTEGEWIIDKAATTIAVGSQHIECTVCGATLRIEQIPVIGVSEPLEFVAMSTPIGVVNCPKRSEPYIEPTSLQLYSNGSAKGYQGHVYCKTESGTVKIATLYLGSGITEGEFIGTFLNYEVRMERFYPSIEDWTEADQEIYVMVQSDYNYVAEQVILLIN